MAEFTDWVEETFNAQDHLLTPKQFFEKRRIAEKIYVFDLRSVEDFEISHVPGAMNIPVDKFEESLYEMPFSDEILLYGNKQNETLSAAAVLYDNGFGRFYYVDSYDTLIKGVDISFISISKKAQDYIENVNSSLEKPQGISIIIEPKADRKANYSVQFIDVELSNIPKLPWTHINFEKFQVLVSKDVIPYLEGTEVKLNESTRELEAFNPNMSIVKFEGTVEEHVQFVLDEDVTPMVADHGGVVTLLEVKDKSVYLEFGGGCKGCGAIEITLKQNIEAMIKEQIPEIETIYDITDHAEGTNPYYQPIEE